MKPIKQTVYIGVSNEDKVELEVRDIDTGETKIWVEEREGYFFTPEQLNEYTSNVIKQALETAAEEVTMYETVEGGSYKSFSTNETDFLIDTNSITNTFEETFNRFKI